MPPKTSQSFDSTATRAYLTRLAGIGGAGVALRWVESELAACVGTSDTWEKDYAAWLASDGKRLAVSAAPF